MEPNLTPYLTKYQMGDPAAITNLLNYLTTWMGQHGSACLQYEMKVIQALQEARIPEHVINVVRANFALWRRTAPVVQKAAEMFKVAPQSIWQGLFNTARTMMTSMAGGMQNFGNWVMNGCRNMGSGLAGAAAALAAIGSLALRSAVAWVGATIGWGPIIIGMVVLALAVILQALWRNNRRQFRGDELLEKAIENNSSPLMPQYQPGNS